VAEGLVIPELLAPSRVARGLCVSGKDALFEALGALLHCAEPDLSRETIVAALLEREHLGGTGIGQGVAVPHGRVPRLGRFIGAFVTVAQAMDYHAIDGKPVTMAFALLVPEHAVQEHLRILSRLAGIFRNSETRQELLAAQTTEEICQCFARAESRADR